MNSVEIEALLAQYDMTNATIEQIYQDDYEHLIIKIYKNREKKYLVINLSKYSHFYIIDNYNNKRFKTLRFKELLQSKLRYGIISKIEYHRHDRSILFHVKRGNVVYFFLILLWAHVANIYLCTTQWILIDAYYRKKNEIAQRQIDRYRNTSYYLNFNKNNSEDVNRFIKKDASLHDEVAQFYRNKPMKEMQSSIKVSMIGVQQKRLEQYRSEHLRLQNSSLSVFIEAKEQEFFSRSYTSLEEYQLCYQQFQEEMLPLYTQQKRDAQRILHLSGLINKMEKENLTIGVRNEDAFKPLASIKKSFLQFESLSYRILVGRNSQSNDMLLRQYTRGLDYWFHIRADKGSHVIIKYRKDSHLSDEVIQDACALAHYYSKKRQQNEVEITFAQVKDLKKLKKSGLVDVQRGKTLFYVYSKERINRLLQEQFYE